MSASPVILLPAYNEEASLPRVLPALFEAYPDFDVLVVDDGSRDATGVIARQCGATVLRHPFNLGYGAALQTGYKRALQMGAPLVVQLDADGQHDPQQLLRLVQPILDDTADLVVGSRFLEPTSYHMSFARSLGRACFRKLAHLSKLEITDPTSGFQAMNRRTLELYSQAFFPRDYPDIDVLLVAHREGLRIRECSVEMLPEQRKSKLHGGMRSFYYVYRLTLSLWANTAPRS